MWPWLIGSYVALLLVLTGCAGFVTLFVVDDGRRAQSFKVLRLLLGASTGIVVATALRLYETGLIG